MYPCSAQPQSIPAVPNRRVSLQCPTSEYPCSAQPKYLCSAQCQNVLVVPSPCNAEFHSNCPCSAKLQLSCSAFAVVQGRQFRGSGGGQGNITFGAITGFRVGMLEENNLTSPTTQGNHVSPVTIVCHQHRANFPHPRQFRPEAFHKGLFLVTEMPDAIFPLGQNNFGTTPPAPANTGMQKDNLQRK